MRAGRRGPPRLPVISIVTDMTNLFGSAGIYDNPTKEGVAWERPASFEIFYPDGREGKQVNCGLRIQGGSSRTPANSPKHSFRVLFKDLYCDETAVSAVSRQPSRRVRHRRAPGRLQQHWFHWDSTQRARTQYIPDQWARDTQLAMGPPLRARVLSPTSTSTPLLGRLIVRRPTARWPRPYLGARRRTGTRQQRRSGEGDKVAWTNLQALANAGLTSLSAYAAVQACASHQPGRLHDHEPVRRNSDWDAHNWYAAGGARPTPFPVLFVGSERMLEATNTNVLGLDNANNPSRVFTRLMQNAEYRCSSPTGFTGTWFNRRRIDRRGGLEPLGGAAHGGRRGPDRRECAMGDYRRDVHPYSNGPYQLTILTGNTRRSTPAARLQFPGRGTVLLAHTDPRTGIPPSPLDFAPHAAGSTDRSPSRSPQPRGSITRSTARIRGLWHGHAYGPFLTRPGLARPVDAAAGTRAQRNQLERDGRAVFLDTHPSPLRIGEILAIPAPRPAARIPPRTSSFSKS
jgi:hypothetical protein